MLTPGNANGQEDGPGYPDPQNSGKVGPLALLSPNMAFSLDIWTIYDHPKDFPKDWVARRYIITPQGPIPTFEIFLASSLLDIQQYMNSMGLTRLPRSQDDDPVVVESWI